MNANKQIQSLLDKAFSIAIDELIRICRETMLEFPELKHCCIGMGTVAFYESDGTPIWCDDKRNKKVDDFLIQWDRSLGLTGYPAKFTAKGEVKNDW